MSTLFINAWYKKSLWCYLLYPFSLIYQSMAILKRWLYLSGYKKQIRFSVPVVVVGNITVGGTGKTPLVIALAHFLSENGYKPGIVSRGYGGKPQIPPLLVTESTSPREAGDEAVLMAQKTHCPVAVSPKRVAAIGKLITEHHCDVILSDDGMQHYQMYRDIEVAVIDGERRFGNGLCLPAGPLREPISRLKQVNFVVSQGRAEKEEWLMLLQPGEIYQLISPTQKLIIPAKKIHAVAGIGNPGRFFMQLEMMGFSVIPHPFPDHYVYRREDIFFNDEYPVIMTEKDAVKCDMFADARHWCLPVKASYDPAFGRQLLGLLRRGEKSFALY